MVKDESGPFATPRSITGRLRIGSRAWPQAPEGLTDIVGQLGQAGQTGIFGGTGIRVRRPAPGRKDRSTCISGKNKQNVVKAMVFTEGDGRLPFCPTPPGICADTTHELGLVELLADGPAVEILADADYQRLGAHRSADAS